MTPNSAYELVPIVKGTDYSPQAITEAFVDPNTGAPVSPAPTVSAGNTAPIFAMLCTASGAGSVVIRALGNDSDITIPGVAFVEGVVYYIYLKKLVDDNSGAFKFVGYRYKQTPLTL